jgi:hypothetical protein
MNQTPITYSTTIYPFGEPGLIQSNNWVLWDSDALNPLTISFDSNLSVMSIWIPQLTGPVTFYAGDTATGTPFYISGGAGSELVPIPVDTLDVTMVGSGGDMYVYYTSLVLDPFRQGVIGNQVTAVTATAPILSSGGTQPNISLQVPLAIGYGGTGTVTPVGVVAASGSGVIITGSFPDQTISLDFAGLGVVTAVTATAPIYSSEGTTPNISLTGIVAQAQGGTGTADPGTANGSALHGATPGAGIAITGTIFDASNWYFTNLGVLSIGDGNANALTGDLLLESTDGSVVISYPGAGGPGNAYELVNLQATSGSLGKTKQLTGTNPSGSLSLTLPNGNWIVQTYASGLDAPEVSTGGAVATLTLSTGPVAGFNGAQYTRYVMCADTVSSSGSTVVTATLASSGGVTVNDNYSAVFLVLTATSVA